MEIENLENLENKNPKVMAEYFFEKYRHDQIQGILKNIQYFFKSFVLIDLRKKIIEKNNSLKMMLSQRYVDLLDCSELIEDLKIYSFQINELIGANENAIKTSLGSIANESVENREDLNVGLQEKVERVIDPQILLAELYRNSSEIKINSFEKVLIASCSDADELTKVKLKRYLLDCFERTIYDFYQLKDKSLKCDEKEASITFFVIERIIKTMKSWGKSKELLNLKIFSNFSDDQRNKIGELLTQDDTDNITINILMMMITQILNASSFPIKDIVSFWIQTYDNFLVLEKFPLNNLYQSLLHRHGKLGIFKKFSIPSHDFAKLKWILQFNADAQISVIGQAIEKQGDDIMKEQIYCVKSNIIRSLHSGEIFTSIQKEKLEEIGKYLERPIAQEIEQVFGREWKKGVEKKIGELVNPFDIKEEVSKILEIINRKTTSFPEFVSSRRVITQMNPLMEIINQIGSRWGLAYDELGKSSQLIFKAMEKRSDIMQLEDWEQITKEKLENKKEHLERTFENLMNEIISNNVQDKTLSFGIILMISIIEGINWNIVQKPILEIGPTSSLKDLLDNILCVLYEKIELILLPKVFEQNQTKKVLAKIQKFLIETKSSLFEKQTYFKKIITKIAKEDTSIDDQIDINYANLDYFTPYKRVPNQKTEKKSKENIGIEKSLFLGMLESEVNEGTVNYDMFSVQKLLAKKNLTRKYVKQPENVNTTAPVENKVMENIDQITEKTKNILEGVMKKFKL